jgi:hypothetical protein
VLCWKVSERFWSKWEARLTVGIITHVLWRKIFGECTEISQRFRKYKSYGKIQRHPMDTTAICELIIQKTWEPWRLTTLWVSTAGDRNTLPYLYLRTKEAFNTRNCMKCSLLSELNQTSGGAILHTKLASSVCNHLYVQVFVNNFCLQTLIFIIYIIHFNDCSFYEHGV